MTTYNGYTPTPTNPERIEYDLNQQEFWNAATMVYLFEQEFRPTEADADKLHDLLITCNTYPNHITNAQQDMGGDTVSPVEVAPWDGIPDVRSPAQTELDEWQAETQATREADYPC